MSSVDAPLYRPRRRLPAAVEPLLILCALSLGAVTDAQAAKLKYSSYIKGATVFRDANGNGEPDGNELQTVTDDDGNFELAKAKGRLYLKDGTDIRTG